MQEYNPLTTTKISKTFDIPGYVIDSNILNRVHAIAQRTVAGTDDVEPAHLQSAYWVTTGDEDMLKFGTIDAIIAYLDSEPVETRSISLQYVTPGQAGISLVFQTKGKIELSAYGNALDFQFNIDQLSREIQRCDQEYSWLVRTFVFRPFTRRMLGSLLGWLSLFLLFNVGYYLYASRMGVNVDPSIIPSGNTYFQEVEETIRSEDIARKLDTLLIAQLRGFTNVQDILLRQERLIFFSLVAVAITIALVAVFRAVVRLYPLSFFAFASQEKVLADLHRKREIWGVAIIISFIVNLVAGLIVALLD